MKTNITQLVNLYITILMSDRDMYQGQIILDVSFFTRRNESIEGCQRDMKQFCKVDVFVSEESYSWYDFSQVWRVIDCQWFPYVSDETKDYGLYMLKVFKKLLNGETPIWVRKETQIYRTALFKKIKCCVIDHTKIERIEFTYYYSYLVFI